MDLRNEFVILLGVDETWALLTDVERIAPCMPGAFLTSAEGNCYAGGVKIKVGPITAAYDGTAEFVELDGAAHRAVLKAQAREASGNGNASARVVIAMTPSGSSTQVSVTTELAVSGRLAQFGRGVMADISSRLVGQFVAALERDVLSGQPKGRSGTVAASALGPSRGGPSPGSTYEVGTHRDVAAEAWPDTEDADGHAPELQAVREPVEAEPLDVGNLLLPMVRGAALPAAGSLGAISALVLVVRAVRRRRRR